MYSGKSGCIRLKVVVFRKVVVFGEKWLYSGKIGWLRAKVVVFGQKWLCSGKSGCIRAKLPPYRSKWLHSGNVVVFGQSECIQAR